MKKIKIFASFIFLTLTACMDKWEEVSEEEAITFLKNRRMFIDEMYDFKGSQYIDTHFDPYNSRFRVTFLLPNTLSKEDWLYHLANLKDYNSFEQSKNNPMEWSAGSTTIRYSLYQERYIYTEYCYTC